VSRRSRRLIAPAAAVLVLAAAPLLARHLRAPPSEARTHLHRVFDRLAAADRFGARDELLAMWTADPRSVAPLLEALRHTSQLESDTVGRLLTALARTSPDTILGQCLRNYVARYEAQVVPHPRLAWRPGLSRDARLCLVYDAQYRNLRISEAAHILEEMRWTARTFPTALMIVDQLGNRLIDFDRVADSERFARLLMRSREHAMVRMMGYAMLPYALHRTGRHHEAARIERAAWALAQQLGPGAHWTRVSMTGHDRLLRRPDTDSALAAHARTMIDTARPTTLRLDRLMDPTAGRLSALGNAVQLLDWGELETSLILFDSVESVARGAGTDRFVAQTLMRKGRALVKLGRLEEGERALLEARIAAQRSGAIQAAFEVEHNLLHLYEAMGNDSLTREAGAAYIAQTALADSRAQHLMAYHDMAWYHQRRGETDRAVPFFRGMLAEARTIEGQAYWAGEYFELAGELDSAMAYYRRDATEYEWQRRTAALARLAEAMGQMDSAVVFARVHDQEPFANSFPERAPLLPGLLARLGRRAEAVREYERAAAAAAGRGQPAAWSRLAAQLAALRLEMGGDAAAAARLADSAAASAARAGAMEERLIAESVAGLARVRQGGGEAARGLAAMRDATRRAERAALPLPAARLQVQLAEALAALGRVDEALAALRRAAGLNDVMAASLAADPQRTAFRAEAGTVSDLALAMIAATRSAARFAAWSVRRKGRGILDATGRPDELDLTTLRQRLPAEGAVVDYAVTSRGTSALVVTRSGASIVPLAVGRDSLAARVDRLLAGLAPRLGSRVDTARARLDVTLAAQLYQDLIAPLLPALGARTTLIIVPDGPLHRLPFDALVTVPSAALEFLLDRFTVSYTPSLALVGRTAIAPPGGLAVVAAGPGADPAGVADEVAAVAAALADRRPVVVAGDSGTETSLRRLAPLAGLLHVAAHARPNDVNPAFARLTLSPGSGDDGLLHAFEIERLRLPGTLVVLSACETGVGRLAGGEGALSLSRAFLRAGAGGTIATLWPVGAGAAPLMAAFYRELAAGRPPAQALRHAKIAQRRGGGPFAAPLHWAAFTLVSGGL
jgi:CHAT domain-containing protein/tetratricopeptide (TPR) repeat protein